MITHFKLISDVHNDGRVSLFGSAYFPKVNPELDKETLLIVAGDMGNGKNWKHSADWLLKLGKQYCHVVAVLGNHDYWGGDINETVRNFKQYLAQNQTIHSVHLIQNEVVVLDNVKILGGTMWTDMDKGNPLIMSNARRVMVPDYANTSIDGQPICPNDIVKEAEYTQYFIFNNAVRSDENQKVIVVTHHAPSIHSIHSRYKTRQFDAMNHYFYSDLEHQLCSEAHDIDYWCHGHVHDPFDYVVDRTRILCNPTGYAHETNKFDEDFLEKL